ncbi:ankyrin repeat domain-containing protein [bacterium]|nr:ankyrin repeat domain-containing protein [bacterium]
MKILLTTLAAVVLEGTAFADPIHDAAKSGDFDVVQAELEKGVDVNAKINTGPNASWNPLYFASRNSHKDVAELLLSNGADVNAKTDRGSTPLLAAVARGHKEIAELLIANGANVKDPNVTLLYEAARNGHTELTELLIAVGAGLNTKNRSGVTPLHEAAFNGHKVIVELLVAAGADVNAVREDGYTPLDMSKLHPEIAELLRKHGGKTGEEIKALISAATSGELEAVKKSIADGIDVNTKDVKGVTPLHHAVRNGHKEIVKLLILSGADVNATDKQDAETPLHWAAYAGENDIVELLVKSGADLNSKRNIVLHSKDRLGATPLDHALNRKKYDTVDLLRKYGGMTGPEDIAYQFESINNNIALFQHLIIGDVSGDSTDEPSIEKLQGVFVIKGKTGDKYEIQYHTGDNNWQMREEVTLQSNRQLYIDSSSYDEKRIYRVILFE